MENAEVAHDRLSIDLERDGFARLLVELNSRIESDFDVVEEPVQETEDKIVLGNRAYLAVDLRPHDRDETPEGQKHCRS